jgi:excisionase family DNA binding protein
MAAELLTTTEVASRLGVHRGTVWRWVLAGLLPSVRLPSGQLRFTAAAVDDLLARGSAGVRLDPDTAELLEFLRRHDNERAGSLCPRCAHRRIDPASGFGWCTHCTVERQVAEDERKDRERARKLRVWHNNPQFNERRNAKRRAKQATGGTK